MATRFPTIVKRLTPRFVKEAAKRAFFPEYRELVRLRGLPRYERTTTTLMGEPLNILDAHSFLTMYQEIVDEAIYHFDSDVSRPYIIDGGANIGISVLYFKKIYPDAQIVAFEPDGDAFDLLKKNVEKWGLSDVELLSSALGSAEGRAGFMAEGSYAGRVARDMDSSTTSVSTVRLRPYLERDVELLKLNIEGAETEVLADCADLLGNVKRIVLEYHSFANEAQTFHELTDVLASAGFRIYVRSVNNNWASQPFVNIPVHLGMDLQLYIYAFRDKHFQGA